MNSLLAKKIEAGDFIITAEYLPGQNMDSIPADELNDREQWPLMLLIIPMVLLFRAWLLLLNFSRQILNLFFRL